MRDRRDSTGVSRRRVLRTGAVATGGVVFGGAVVAGQSDDEDDDDPQGRDDDEHTDLVTAIEAHGHYAWFPLGPDSWGRSRTPVDMEDGESRWVVEPVPDGGGVRCLGENFGTEPPNRNAGFDVHLGRLGAIEAVSITARTLQTPRTTGPARLFIGLYLDTDDNGEFFEWEAADDMERFVGLGGDEEGLATYGASGEVLVDGDTAFALVGAETEATIAELQAGSVDGISGETAAALYVGVINDGEGTDEVVVEEMTVLRS